MATSEQTSNDVRSEIERRFDEFESAVTERLDELERRLPPIPRKAVTLGRASAARIGATTGGIARDIERQFSRVTAVAGDAVNTSKGQTRSAVDRTATTLRRNTNEAVGQTRAQMKRSATAAERGTVALLDDATRAVETNEHSPAALEEWTKADLYDRAQELDIQGRSTMAKRELMDAIRAS
ncbi:MAG: hypothetical protein WCA90_04440 [Ilumatobacteraceae bacterium]